MHPYEVAQTLRSGPSRRASGSTTGPSTPWSSPSRRRASSRPPARSRKASGPQRTVYEITDAGATEMTDWLTELIGTPAKEYPAFMAGLSFLPALDPDDALGRAATRADALTVMLVSLRGVEKAAREAGLPRIFGLEAEYEEGQLAAELEVRHGPRRRDAVGHPRGARPLAPVPVRRVRPRGGALLLRSPQGVTPRMTRGRVVTPRGPGPTQPRARSTRDLRPRQHSEA